MKWFDSDYDYIDEFTTQWNERYKKAKRMSIILSIVLIFIGILCFAFPEKVFTTIQIIAAIGLIVWGACEIYSYITTTFFFRDAMWLASGILNILLGCLLCTMPVTITVSTLTFLFAFVLLVNGIQKITWGSRLSFFRVIDTKYLSLTGWVNLLLGIIFLVMPFQSALVINYNIATYLVVAGLSLLIEAVSMKKI